MSRIYPLIQNPAGAAFSADDHRFCVVAAGRRSGKTERSKRKMIIRAMRGGQFTPSRYAMLAPTFGQAQAIFWDDLKAMTPGIQTKKPSESRLAVWIPGAEIHVKGLDQPQRIEGQPWDGFVVDEVDDLKEGFWEEHLRPCLSDRKGWAIFLGVPNGYRVLYKLSSMCIQFPDEWSYHHWPSSEILEASEIESAKNGMDEKTFRQEYEATFETLAGRVYYAFDRAKNTRALPEDLRSAPWSAGMDFNVDPMSVRIFVEDSKDTFFCGEITIRNSNTEEMGKELMRRFPQVKIIYPDPAGGARKTSAKIGETDLAILKEMGFALRYRHITKSVKDGINAVNSWCCSASGERHLFVTPDLKQTPEDLERHLWKQGASIPENDKYVHGCDCIRYPMEFLHPMKTFERKYANAR